MHDHFDHGHLYGHWDMDAYNAGRYTQPHTTRTGHKGQRAERSYRAGLPAANRVQFTSDTPECQQVTQ